MKPIAEPRAMGRPRIAPVALTVRINERTHDALKYRSARDGVPMGALLRGLIEEATDTKEDKP